MKLLFENWQKYLLKEQTDLWGYHIDPEQRTFISSEPFKGMRDVKQGEFVGFSEPNKPEGLWYACGDDWIQWIRINTEWLNYSNYLYEIKLGGNILKLTNVRELIDFQEKYERRRKYDMEGINWAEIAEEGYDGIEVCPYIRKLWFRGIPGTNTRLGNWYGSWDAASGCVWNKSAVLEINLLAERDEPPPPEDEW